MESVSPKASAGTLRGSDCPFPDARMSKHQTRSLPMAERTIVYRANPDSDTSDKVASRLRARGIEIVDEQQNMPLVNGAIQKISKALGDAAGWNLTAETKTPPPDTRKKILKPLAK